MNNFLKNFGDSLREEFKIEVEDFISKKKKLVHMSLVKPLILYTFFKEIINFGRKYWDIRKRFYPGYFSFVSEA